MKYNLKLFLLSGQRISVEQKFTVTVVLQTVLNVVIGDIFNVHVVNHITF